MTLLAKGTSFKISIGDFYVSCSIFYAVIGPLGMNSTIVSMNYLIEAQSMKEISSLMLEIWLAAPS